MTLLTMSLITFIRQFQLDNLLQFGEVQFFFQFRLSTQEVKTLAMVSVWGRPHEALLKVSSKTVWFSEYRGDNDIRIIDAKSIESVVAMVPEVMNLPVAPSVDFETIEDLVPHNGSFVGEKPGLAMSHMGGADEPDEEQGLDDDDDDEDIDEFDDGGDI